MSPLVPPQYRVRRWVRLLSVCLALSVAALVHGASTPRPSCADDLETYSDRAKSGDPEAQCSLGYLYEEGKQVPQDYREAMT